MPDRQALPVLRSAIGLLCQIVMALPVVLALFEVPACPWLRSPSSQTAKGKTPLAGRLGLVDGKV